MAETYPNATEGSRSSRLFPPKLSSKVMFLHPFGIFFADANPVPSSGIQALFTPTPFFYSLTRRCGHNQLVYCVLLIHDVACATEGCTVL